MQDTEPSQGAHQRVADRGRWQKAATVAVAVPVVALLVACGSGGSSSSDAPVATATTAGPSHVPAAKGRLDFLGFEGDDSPKLLAPWAKKSGVSVKASYISAESEIEAKLLGGGARGVDLLSFASPAASALATEGILQPIDPRKLPNLAHVWSFFREHDRGVLLNSKGQWVAIPFYWGGIGIAWDSSVVPKVTSFKDILNPAFKGKVGMADAPGPAIYAACTVLKCQPAQLTQADLARVKAYLLPIFGQVKSLSPSFGDLIGLLGSKEIAAVYPGFTFLAGGAQAAGNKDAQANVNLTEGAPLVIEAYGIAKGADNADAAYAFINEVLSPSINAQVAAAQGAIPSVTDAVPSLDAGTKSLYPYDTLPDYYASANLPVNPPRKSDKYVTDKQVNAMWSELKQTIK
jgi:spermidine/putrescine-binding protein